MKKQEPSQELINLVVVELKNSIKNLRELYIKIDKNALEEGFDEGEIYDVTHDQYKSNETPTATTTDTTIKIKMDC